MSLTAAQIPGYREGTWVIDPSHSEVSFSVKHLAISRVKGRFEEFEGTLQTGPDPLATSVRASVNVASINTRDENRDGHLKNSDFFAADEFPQITFVSTGAREENGAFFVDGDFTMRGVTRNVTFEFELGGFGADHYGNYKVGFTATTVVQREDFGVTWNAPLETGGLLLGKDVTITLDIQAALRTDEQ